MSVITPPSYNVTDLVNGPDDNVGDLRTIAQQIRKADAEFIESLIARYEAMKHEKDNVVKENDKLKRQIERNKFVLSLIDGDQTLFHVEYVKVGVQGGERAARILAERLREYLDTQVYFRGDTDIVVRIYINLDSCGEAYTRLGVRNSKDTFRAFVQGFNKTHESMMIIDAGNGKEGADSKIRAEFKQNLGNLHCQQIMLAGSGDNGYGGLLRPHTATIGKSDKVTLIRSLPFARELQYLAENSFEVVSFDDIFRDCKIENHDTQSDAFETTRTLVNSPPKKFAGASPPRRSADIIPLKRPWSCAATAMGGDEAWTTISVPIGVDVQARPYALNPGFIQVNCQEQRIDTQLPAIDFEVRSLLVNRSTRFCNNHYLNGICHNRSKCRYEHDAIVSIVQQGQLRHMARELVCPKGVNCWDSECLKGHQCPNGQENNCKFAMEGRCNFSRERHQVDMTGLKQIYVG